MDWHRTVYRAMMDHWMGNQRLIFQIVEVKIIADDDIVSLRYKKSVKYERLFLLMLAAEDWRRQMPKEMSCQTSIRGSTRQQVS